jgi:hypothetical protein
VGNGYQRGEGKEGYVPVDVLKLLVEDGHELVGQGFH